MLDGLNLYRPPTRDAIVASKGRDPGIPYIRPVENICNGEFLDSQNPNISRWTKTIKYPPDPPEPKSLHQQNVR